MSWSKLKRSLKSCSKKNTTCIGTRQISPRLIYFCSALPLFIFLPFFKVHVLNVKVKASNVIKKVLQKGIGQVT